MAEAPSERKEPRVSSPISRILSHGLLRNEPQQPAWATIYLRPFVAGRLMRPTRRLGRATLERLLFGLAPGGACLAAVSPRRRCALTAPFHLRSRTCRRAVSFLLRFPWGFPRWTLSSTLLCGVRTFLEDPPKDASPRLPRLRAKYNRIGRERAAAESRLLAHVRRPALGDGKRLGEVAGRTVTDGHLVERRLLLAADGELRDGTAGVEPATAGRVDRGWVRHPAG